MFKKLFGGGKKEEEKPHNTLTVVVHEMRDMKRTKLLHDPNSFIQLRMIAKNGKKPAFKKVARTGTIKGNLHPRWEQTFKIEVGNPFDEILQIDLYDVGAVFGGEEDMGNAFVPLETLTATPSIDAFYIIQSLDTRMELGKLHLTLTYEGFGAVPAPTAPPMAPPTAPLPPTAPMPGAVPPAGAAAAPMPAYAPGYGQQMPQYPQAPQPQPQPQPQGAYYPPINPDQPPPRPPKPGDYSASPVPQPQPVAPAQQPQPQQQPPQQQQQQQATGLPPSESIYSDLYPILE